MDNGKNKQYSFPVTMAGKILSYSGIEQLTYENTQGLIKHLDSRWHKNLKSKYEELFSRLQIKNFKHKTQKISDAWHNGQVVLLPQMELQLEDCSVNCDFLLTFGCEKYESNVWVTLSYSENMRGFGNKEALKFYDSTSKLGLSLADIMLDEYSALINKYREEERDKQTYALDVEKIIVIKSAETIDKNIKNLVAHEDWGEDDFNFKKHVVKDDELFDSLKDLLYWSLGRNFNTYKEFTLQPYNFIWVKMNVKSKKGIFLNNRQQHDDGTIHIGYTGLGLGSNNKHKYRKSASYGISNDLWLHLGSRDLNSDN